MNPSAKPETASIHGVNDTRNPTQDGQTDVDEEVGAASALQEDTQRGQDEGQDELADVTEGNILAHGF